MKDEIVCQACECSDTTVERYADVVEYKGITLSVTGLWRTSCGECGYQFSTGAQHDSNVDIIRAAFTQQRAAAKREMGRLTGDEIRAIRIGLRLSQQEASELFGGGVNAFSRYENEEVVQPAGVDGFLRLAAYLGVEGLAAIRASKQVTKVRHAEIALSVAPPGNGAAIVELIPVNTTSLEMHLQTSSGAPRVAQAETRFVTNPLTGAMARVGY